jgi:hypothetical protein
MVNAMKKINLQDIISAAAQTAMVYNPTVDYDADTHSEIQQSAQAIIAEFKLLESALSDLLVYREKVELHLRKRYGVKFTQSPSDNIEQKMKRKRVPQKMRVEHGILDVLIGELYVKAHTA